MRIITHLKLRIAWVGHNFKWVKNGLKSSDILTIFFNLTVILLRARLLSLYASIQKMGFSVLFSTACTNGRPRVLTEPGHVRSPQYPDNYPENSYCAWHINSEGNGVSNVSQGYYVLVYRWYIYYYIPSRTRSHIRVMQAHETLLQYSGVFDTLESWDEKTLLSMSFPARGGDM